ncbi:unnamed protein product [Bursaphelenchus xylophilus]|uniref:(pine wood nematode) hypothetical protein n=1 Tax=Bursaphelenchus xylophilus TaxID=6326 RepID=A0A1I7SE36_BURXY|nr:unnamed protein product [Bursaphelenchus xylophilus]CAG9113130.1 unnamed protein product [Bursaphelenchus xylophilus]
MIVKAVEQSHAIIPVKSTPVPSESPPTKRPRKSTPRKVESSDRELDPLDALINNVMATTSPKPRGRPKKRSIKDFEAISDATTTTLPQPIHSATLYVTPTSPIPLNLADLRAKTPRFLGEKHRRREGSSVGITSNKTP